MSHVKLVPLGPGRFEVFLDGNKVTQVANVDTSGLVQKDALPTITITLRPDSFEVTGMVSKNHLGGMIDPGKIGLVGEAGTETIAVAKV